MVIRRPQDASVDAGVEDTTEDTGRGSRPPVAVLAALAVAVLLGAFASSPATAPDDADASDRLEIERRELTAAPLPPAFARGWTGPRPGAWAALPEAPLGPRVRHTVVALRDGMLVWGGYQQGRPLSNGAIFRVSTGRWETIPDAPQADDGHVAVLARDRLLLLDERSPMSFDLDAREWRRLPPPPLPDDLLLSDLAAWTGRLAVVLTGRTGRPAGPGLLYDPEVERWTTIAAPPGALTGGHDLVWDGRDLYLFGPSPAGVEGFAHRLRFDYGGIPPRQGSNWAPVPPPPLDTTTARRGQARALAVGNPPRIYMAVGAAVGTGARLLDYAPTLSGERLGIWHDWGDSLPLPQAPALAWTGDTLLAVTPGRGVAYEPRTARVRPLPAPDVPINAFAEPAWSSSHLLWWGGGSAEGAAWQAP